MDRGDGARRHGPRGLSFGTADVYLNVAGGLRIGEPAADLAVAAALASSASDNAMPAETVVFGEIGLSGEVRAVARAGARLKEAAKLGFSRAIVPTRRSGRAESVAGIKTTEVAHVVDLLTLIGTGARAGAPERRAGGA